MARTIVGMFEDSSAAKDVLRELRSLGLQEDQARLLNNEEALSESADDTDDGPPPAINSLNAEDVSSSAPLSPSETRSAYDFSETNTLDVTDAPRVAEPSEHGDQPWTQKIKSWFSSMFDDDDDRKHADHYAEAWRRGHTLVVADVDDSLVDQVVDLMNQNGAVDIQRRSEHWKQTGYTGVYDAAAAPYSSEQFQQERATYPAREPSANGETESIPVVQEELAVGKRVVQRGGVRIHSYVQERPVEEIVRLRDERVNVTRVPVDRAADPAELAFTERTIEVTASGEEAVVEKRARVVEEVVVNKEVDERDERIEETVRRKDVQVENVGSDSAHHSN